MAIMFASRRARGVLAYCTCEGEGMWVRLSVFHVLLDTTFLFFLPTTRRQTNCYFFSFLG